MSWTVKVINKGPVDLRERFKGKEIEIKAGGFVEMDRDEAVEFAAQYKPIATDGEMNIVPAGFKRLGFEPGLYENPNLKKEDDLVCHATGERALNKAELNKLIRENAHLLADDKAKEALNDEMNAQLEAIRADVAKLAAAKGNGRSGKDKGPDNDKGKPAA